MQVTIEPSRGCPLYIELPSLDGPFRIDIPADDAKRRNVIYLTPDSSIKFPDIDASIILRRNRVSSLASRGADELQVAASAEPSQVNSQTKKRPRSYLQTQASAALSNLVEETPRKDRIIKDIDMAPESQPFSTAIATTPSKAASHAVDSAQVSFAQNGTPHLDPDQDEAPDAAQRPVDIAQADGNTEFEAANGPEVEAQDAENTSDQQMPGDPTLDGADQAPNTDSGDVDAEMDLDDDAVKQSDTHAAQASPTPKKRKIQELGSDDERLTSNKKKKAGSTYAKSNKKTKESKSPPQKQKHSAKATRRGARVVEDEEQASEDVEMQDDAKNREDALEAEGTEPAAPNGSNQSAFTPINADNATPLTPTSPDPAPVEKKRGPGRPAKVKKSSATPALEKIIHPSVEITKSSDPAEDADVTHMSPPPATDDSVSSISRKKLHIAFSGSTVPEQNMLRKFLLRHANIDNNVTDRTDYVCTGKGNLKRTTKVLLALLHGKPILSDQWIVQSAKKDQLLEPTEYFASDPTAEKKANVDSQWSRGESRKGLLDNMTLYFSPAAADSYDKDGWKDIQKVAKLAGAKKILTGDHESIKMPATNLIALGSSKDDVDIMALSEKEIPCFDREWLGLTILRGEIDLEVDRLGAAKPAKEKKGRDRRSKG